MAETNREKISKEPISLRYSSNHENARQPLSLSLEVTAHSPEGKEEKEKGKNKVTERVK